MVLRMGHYSQTRTDNSGPTYCLPLIWILCCCLFLWILVPNFLSLLGCVCVCVCVCVCIYLFKNINLFILFIYFWLCLVFVAARRLSLVAASRGYSSLRCVGFSLGDFSSQSRGSRRVGFSSCGMRLSSCGSWALEHRLSSCGARA